jgi:hypothetical protein
VGSPTSPSPYQGSAASWPTTQQGLTAAQTYNWAHQGSPLQAQAASVAPPTYSPQPTPVYYQTQAAPPAIAPQAAPQEQASADSYLDNISNQSLEILQYFGPEAPARLNLYATRIEDALTQSVEHQQKQSQFIQQQSAYIEQVRDVLMDVAREREGMMAILSDPDELVDYFNGFFGPNGPVPVQTPGEQARAALEQGMVSREGPLMGFPNHGLAPEGNAQQAQFQRPQMPMPTPSGNQGISPRQAWSRFSQLAESDPTRAWMALDQMGPDVLRSKVLVMEG